MHCWLTVKIHPQCDLSTVFGRVIKWQIAMDVHTWEIITSQKAAFLAVNIFAVYERTSEMLTLCCKCVIVILVINSVLLSKYFR